ncbi:hypothetical protein M231_01188 [Tremella mesenterica]|uniref:Autophagy-related protein 27 n=1 Tax=Tremella mesenterica TaxID=5217 RepID=A0A4Q1BTZ4_TREME|nr:hypothetical protein M231_01188 [Tremella mesenterica]
MFRWGLIFLLAIQTQAFDCSLSINNVPYDLSPLSGLRESTKDASTPPTTSRAKVLMDLCGNGVDDDSEGDDKCPPTSLVCLKLLNIKPSSSEPERITSVIPLWSTDTPAEDVEMSALDKGGRGGVRINVRGPEYAGSQQNLNLTLLCSSISTEPTPEIISYTSNLLSLEWSTPDACPHDNSSSDEEESGGGEGGIGFWGFMKFLFWLGVIGLILYFVIGITYNHQQYSARGFDLIPHRDFWRELPSLIQDLSSHLLSGLRGGRGGYHSLG